MALAQSVIEKSRGNSAIILHSFFVVSLLIVMGGFTLQLAGTDPRLIRKVGEGSILSQSVIGVIYLTVIVILLKTPKALTTALRAWPIFLLPVFATASAIWAPDPQLTLRRAIAFIGTTIFALCLGCVYDFKGCIRLLIHTLFVAMILSLIWVILFPSTGIHQASDALEPIHAGKWRGIFAHKNALGLTAGFNLSMLVLYGRIAFRSTHFRIAAIAVTLPCLLFAVSGTGYTVAFSVTVVGLILSFVARVHPEWRIALIVTLALLCVLSFFFADTIEGVALQVLDKDPDLTGRTLYWSYIWPFMEEHWLLGYGYFSGFLSIDPIIATITMLNLGETHNGYLDLIVSLGIIGAILATIYLLWLLAWAVGLMLEANSHIGVERTFPLCIIFFTIEVNFVESAILAANSLWPLILALIATMMMRRRRFSSKLNMREDATLRMYAG